MDFSFDPTPILDFIAPNRNAPDAVRFRAYVAKRFELIGDVALPAAVFRFAAAGRLFSTSCKLAPGTMKIDTLYLPFTLFVEKPGLLHLSLDVAFYKGVQAYTALEDAYQRAREWLKIVDRQTLENSLGPGAFNELTQGGAIQNIVAVAEMPPAWLTDP